MPPKKRKRKAKTPRGQSQSQRQSVVVNIGSKSTPRKSSGRGGLPPPSHAHNLAPTFVTAPQIDYTPLLAMIQQHARPIVAQAPMPVTTTPLSASIQASTTVGPSAQQMAREAALRRAGQTAGNFQPPASEARMRPEPEPSMPKDTVKAKPPVQPTPLLVQPTPLLVQPNPLVRQSGLTSQTSGLEQAQEAISMIIKANPPAGSVSSVATSAPTKLSSSAVSGQATQEQDLAGFRTKGRPSTSKKLAEKVAKDVASGKQTQLSFKKQGLK
jgi:hypothetical protein